MKPKRILAMLLTFAMLFAILPGNIAFAAKATEQTYGVTFDGIEDIFCPRGGTHTIKSVAVEAETPVDGMVTFNLSITPIKESVCPSPIVIPHTLDISCDKEINLSKQTISNSSGHKEISVTIKKSAKAHNWSNGQCTLCKKNCSHNWDNSKCTTCKLVCGHNWSNGTCTICKITHDNHTWANGACTVCKAAHSNHSWEMHGLSRHTLQSQLGERKLFGL